MKRYTEGMKNPLPTYPKMSKTFWHKERDFINAQRIGNSTILLPLYPKITDE